MHDLDTFLIGGAWVPANGTKTHPMIDPATEEQIGTVTLGSTADLDAAVAAASAAFADWSQTDVAARIKLVERIAEIYEARLDDMARAISQEMGAPIDMARERQAAAGLRHITSFLDVIRDFQFIRPLGDHAPNDRILLQPIGPVGLITPWNWPMNQVALKVTPALLAGCTMVLKPSEFAPLSARLLAEIVQEAGVPAGVFNLVQGDGTLGAAMSRHPDLKMISLTGSVGAGRSVLREAAEDFKRVSLELGGKGANLVFADADDGAVERGVRQCFGNTGQSCNAPSRMLVERSHYERAVETAARVAAEVAVAPPDQAGPHLGPVVNGRQFARIQDLITKGIDEGARLVAGGVGRPEGLNRGFYVRPTVFADVTPEMTIAREEVFGPVLAMMPFDDEDHAVQIANDTPYGLTNYVQSSDGARRNRLAQRLNSGMVEMNGQPRGAGSPFGGVGWSGHGREGGVWGLEEFLVVKAVSAWDAA